MKSCVSLLLSSIIFLASFQNSLFYVDYQLNTAYYQSICINKQKPEFGCNGKCQIKKESEKENSPISEIKNAFELNILPTKSIEISFKRPLEFTSVKKMALIDNDFLLDGFFLILPHPPQNLG